MVTGSVTGIESVGTGTVSVTSGTVSDAPARGRDDVVWTVPVSTRHAPRIMSVTPACQALNGPRA
jgi:hypothetical protein